MIANELEKYAQQKGIKIITTEVSITARPFFEKRGYQVIKQQSTEYKGQILTSFLMEKHIDK